MNQQFTSIGMKGERVDHITLSSESQVSGYIRKENFPHFFFSTFDVDKLGKIRRYHWKKSLKISEIAKFESDLLKTNDEIATQKREFYFGFKILNAIKALRNYIQGIFPVAKKNC